MKSTVVRIEREAADTIKALAEISGREGLETGGFLVGEITNRSRRVLHAIGPGPNAVRTPALFEPDYVYTAQQLIALCEQNPKLKILGGWHLHEVNGLSTGDEATLKKVCASTPGFLALVVCGSASRKARLFAFENGAIGEKRWKLFTRKAQALEFSRTASLVDHEVLTGKHVVVFGFGSGGCETAMLAAYAGVGRFTLVDPERLEKTNLVRHVGKFHQLGMFKVDIGANELRLINPNVKVTAITEELTAENAFRFEPIVRGASVVLALTGRQSTNHLINDLCVKLSKPVIFGGVFERAKGGFALVTTPGRSASPCLNCVFAHAKNMQSDSNADLRRTAQNYGWNEDELAAQQGLYIDIKPISILEAKMALHVLLRRSRHALCKLPGNLAVWDAATMSTRWANVKRRTDCAVCNPEGWLAAREARLLTKSTAA